MVKFSKVDEPIQEMLFVVLIHEGVIFREPKSRVLAGCLFSH